MLALARGWRLLIPTSHPRQCATHHSCFQAGPLLVTGDSILMAVQSASRDIQSLLTRRGVLTGLCARKGTRLLLSTGRGRTADAAASTLASAAHWSPTPLDWWNGRTMLA